MARRSTTWLLYAGLICFSGSVLYSRHVSAAATASAGLPQLGARVPSPHGYDRSGRPIPQIPTAACTLVHYASAGCEYCRAEATVWDGVAAQADKDGCLIREIVPTNDSQTLDPLSGGPIVYLPFEWVDAVPLRAAPTTLLLDHDGRMIWSHLGSLDQQLASSLFSKLATVQSHAVPQRR